MGKRERCRRSTRYSLGQREEKLGQPRKSFERQHPRRAGTTWDCILGRTKNCSRQDKNGAKKSTMGKNDGNKSAELRNLGRERRTGCLRRPTTKKEMGGAGEKVLEEVLMLARDVPKGDVSRGQS